MDNGLIGIDVGTSRCKVTVLDVEGDERAVARRPMPWRRTRAGAELDPRPLIDVVLDTAQRALARAPAAPLAVGVTSMAEAGFLVDARGEPLGPTLAWHDTRAASELEALDAELPEFVARTGLRRTPRPPALRLRQQFRQSGVPHGAARWLSVAEYVVHALGGEPVAEPSLASRTGWLDVDRLRWWDEALGWSGLDRRLLPELRPAGSPAGCARTSGSLYGAVLTVAGHDHLCAAVGAGALDADAVVDSCGTAEVILRATGPPPTACRLEASRAGFTSGRHVLPGRFALIGGFPSGALLDGLVEACGLQEPAEADARALAVPLPGDIPTIEDLDALVEQLRTGPPPSSEEIGILWRQAVEAVADRGGRLLRRLEGLTGPYAAVVTVGGSADGSLVAAARARHLGPLQHPAVTEAAARGAALAAGVAAGVYGDLGGVPRPRWRNASREQRT